MLWESYLKKSYFKFFQKVMILIYLSYNIEFLFIKFVIKALLIENRTLDSI